jgi:hypothetical protein
MGATKKYFITTRQLEDQEFYDWKYKSQQYIENWKAEPNDKEIFKGDEMYKSLLKKYFKAKEVLDGYKHKVRNK